MDRRRKRIYHKYGRSDKWFYFDKLFKKEMKMAKYNFYRNMISDLRFKKPSQWYSSLKRLTSYDQQKNEQLNVKNISHLPDQ